MSRLPYRKWARTVAGLPPLDKLLLWTIADRVDDAGRWRMTMEDLKAVSERSVSTVRRVLDRLAHRNLLVFRANAYKADAYCGRAQGGHDYRLVRDAEELRTALSEGYSSKRQILQQWGSTALEGGGSTALEGGGGPQLWKEGESTALEGGSFHCWKDKQKNPNTFSKYDALLAARADDALDLKMLPAQEAAGSDGLWTELQLGVRRTFEAAGVLTPDLMHVEIWKAKDYDPALCLAVVRVKVARTSAIGSLKYFDAAIAELHDKPPERSRKGSLGEGLVGPVHAAQASKDERSPHDIAKACNPDDDPFFVKVLEHLIAEIDVEKFGSWFADLRLVNREGGELKLSVTSKFKRKYIEEHYGKHLQRACVASALDRIDIVVVPPSSGKQTVDGDQLVAEMTSPAA